MKKVLMVVYNEMVSDSRVHKEAESLGRSGYDVKVLALMKNNLPEFEKKQYYSIQRMRLWTRERFQPKQFLIFKLIELYIKTVIYAFKENALVYHSHDLEPLLPLWVVKLLRRNSKLIYDSHELHVERANLSSKRKKLNYFLEHFLINKVDQVVMSDGDSRINHLKKVHNYQKDVVDIGNFPLINKDGRESTHQDIKKRLGLTEDDFLMVYVGGLSRNRGIEYALPMLQKFKKAHFLLLGQFVDSMFETKFKEKIQELGIRNQVFMPGPVQPEEIITYIKGADLGLCLIKNKGLSYYYSRPTKLFEYLLAGIPVVASDFPEIKKVLQDVNIGWIVNPESAEEVTATLEQAYLELQDNAQRPEQEILKRLEAKYNWENEQKKLIDIYKKID